MARKDYPFHRRDFNRGSKLISGLLAGLLVAPFAIGSASSSSTNDLYDEPVSKTTAFILILVGIALIPLFVPFILFVDDTIFSIFMGFPIGIWAVIIYTVIKAFLQNNESDKKDENEVETSSLSIYEIAVDNIAREAAIKDKYNKIRREYYLITNLNNDIKEKISVIYKKIDKYKNKLKWLGFIPKYRNKYSEAIEILSNEIGNLENSLQEPVIKLSCIDSTISNNVECKENNNLIYLAINENIYTYKLIDFRDLPKSKIDKKKFFKIDTTPISSLCFNSIQFYFYDSYMIVMSKKDFSIIDYNNISINCRVIQIEAYPSKYSEQFKITHTKWLHSRLDGNPDLRFSYNYEQVLVQATIIDLEIYTQKISLIFNKKESASNFISNLHRDMP